MKYNIKKVNKIAKDVNRKLKHTDFDDTQVRVVDTTNGEIHHLVGAFVRSCGEDYIVIFSEHNEPKIFWREDVILSVLKPDYSKIKELENPDKNHKEHKNKIKLEDLFLTKLTLSPSDLRTFENIAKRKMKEFIKVNT